jgi:hypothetical protein
MGVNSSVQGEEGQRQRKKAARQATDSVGGKTINKSSSSFVSVPRLEVKGMQDHKIFVVVVLAACCLVFLASQSKTTGTRALSASNKANLYNAVSMFDRLIEGGKSFDSPPSMIRPSGVMHSNSIRQSRQSREGNLEVSVPA